MRGPLCPFAAAVRRVVDVKIVAASRDEQAAELTLLLRLCSSDG
jgi:hypothetical protein